MMGLGLPGCPAGFWKAKVPGPSSGLWAARLPQILCPNEEPGRTCQSHQVLGQSSWWASHAGKNGRVCVSRYYVLSMTCLPTTGPQKPWDKRAMQAVVRTKARSLWSTPNEEPIHLGGKSRPC